MANSKKQLTKKQMIEVKNSIQSETITKVLAEYVACKKAGRPVKTTINLATGVGKTRTAWKLIFENDKFQTILFMVPKQSLVDQTIAEFMEQGIDFDYCTVYTQGDVKTVEELHQFLNRSTNGKKIVFAVYNSVGVTDERSTIFNDSPFIFDLAIYDECHRVAGKEMSQFTSCVADAVVKAHHKLFMTATVKFYLEGPDENLNEYSMQNEELFGKIAMSLTVFKAIELGILCPFETFLLEVNDSEIRKALRKNVEFYDSITKGRHVATFYGVLNAYNQGARKIIVMYRQISDANDFARLFQYLQRTSGLFQGATIGSVASSASRYELGAPYQYLNEAGQLVIIGNSKRKAQQWWLKYGPFCQSASAVATATPWIKEGEDVPCIDCIVFGDIFKSGIDIIQIIGRALRWYEDKNIARIILPIMQGEATSVATAIRATVGSLQENVSDFQITHVEHVNELTPDPANGQNPDEITEVTETTPRWIFSEDQDGITTLVTDNQLTFSVIHNANTPAATRLEHEHMMQVIGLRATNRFHEYSREQRAEKFIDEIIALLNDDNFRATSVRKINSNDSYYERYANQYSISFDDAKKELSKQIYRIEALRNDFLNNLIQF
jgi:predicted helicase